MSTQRISPGPVLIPPSAADAESALRILPVKTPRSSAAKVRSAKKAKSKIKKTVPQARKLAAAKSRAKNIRSTKKLKVRKPADRPRILLANNDDPQPLLVVGPEAVLTTSDPVLPVQLIEFATADFVVPMEPAEVEPSSPVAEAMPDYESLVHVQQVAPEINLPEMIEGAAKEQALSSGEKSEPSQEPAAGWNVVLRVLTQAWNWLQNKFKTHQGKKRLRVCETVSLGEKRFVAVIQVDGEQFLVGGASNSVSTLAHLARSSEFVDILKSRCEQGLGQA